MIVAIVRFGLTTVSAHGCEGITNGVTFAENVESVERATFVALTGELIAISFVSPRMTHDVAVGGLGVQAGPPKRVMTRYPVIGDPPLQELTS